MNAPEMRDWRAADGTVVRSRDVWLCYDREGDDGEYVGMGIVMGPVSEPALFVVPESLKNRFEGETDE